MQDKDADGFFVSLVGGRGRMGRWLQRMLEDDGVRVVVADEADGPWDPAGVGAAPLVVLAVPVGAVPGVMERLGPHTRPDGAVVDLCSLKAQPLEAMLAHARGEVVGAHPLCGPSAEGLRGQTVFVCRGRGSHWAEAVEGWCRRRGAVVAVVDPAAHDRLMAQVQSLRHLWLAALGLALEELGYDLTRDVEVSGAWFRTLLGLLSHQCGQPPDLYADLAIHNPQADEAVQALGRALGSLGQPLAAGDRDGLFTVLQKVSRWVSPLADREANSLAQAGNVC